MYKRLIEAIEERGITKYRLAKMSGITPQDLYTVLNGHKPLYNGWRKRIAEALEMDEAELFGEDDRNELEWKLQRIAQERVFYKGRLYYVDDYDEGGIYLLRYTCDENGFGHGTMADEICVPIKEYSKMMLCEL